MHFKTTLSRRKCLRTGNKRLKKFLWGKNYKHERCATLEFLESSSGCLVLSAVYCHSRYFHIQKVFKIFNLAVLL